MEPTPPTDDVVLNTADPDSPNTNRDGAAVLITAAILQRNRAHADALRLLESFDRLITTAITTLAPGVTVRGDVGDKAQMLQEAVIATAKGNRLGDLVQAAHAARGFRRLRLTWKLLAYVWMGLS